MKLIKNLKTNLIDFAFDDDDVQFSKGENYIVVNGKKWTNLDPSVYEDLVVLGESVPSYFVPKLYHYNNGWEDSPLKKNLLEEIRKERNKLLSESDWTQLPDVGLPNKEDWDLYRQSLRDLTSNIINPFAVEWPKDPNWVNPYEN